MGYIQVITGRRKPIIAGLGLTDRDRHLIDYWLGKNVRKLETDTHYVSEDLLHGLNYFPAADLRHIEHLTQYYLPLLVVARLHNELSQQELFQFLYETGIVALWLLPSYGAPVIFPQFAPAIMEKRVAFLVQEDKCYRNLLRQLFYFAGYHVQIDFHSAQEVLTALENSSHSCLLLFSLDHSTINYSQLLTQLDAYLHRNPKCRSRLRVLFTKDFAIPGFSFNDLESLLQPHARRVFSQQEAVFALIEGLFSQNVTDASIEKQNIDRVLYGPQKDFFHLSPVDMAQARRILFLWLYEFMSKEAEAGILLEEIK